MTARAAACIVRSYRLRSARQGPRNVDLRTPPGQECSNGSLLRVCRGHPGFFPPDTHGGECGEFLPAGFTYEQSMLRCADEERMSNMADARLKQLHGRLGDLVYQFTKVHFSYSP